MMLNKETANRAIRLGKAGEFRVIAELLLRGFNPALVALDEGVDILLENRLRIQVKTANRSQKRSGLFGNLLDCYYISNAKSVGRNKRGQFLSQTGFDFLICWCVQDDIFYVIPAPKVRSITNISLFPKGKRSKWGKYLDRWDLLK